MKITPVLSMSIALGAVTTANASITYDGGYFEAIGFGDNSFNDYFDPSGDSLDVGNSYDWDDGAQMNYDLVGDQSSISAYIDFDMMIQGAFRFHFTLDSTADVEMLTSGATNSMLLYVTGDDGEMLNVDGASQATLDAGQYYVLFLQDMDGGGATFGSLDLNFTFIPAPGAIALFSLAGFATRRRR